MMTFVCQINSCKNIDEKPFFLTLGLFKQWRNIMFWLRWYTFCFCYRKLKESIYRLLLPVIETFCQESQCDKSNESSNAIVASASIATPTGSIILAMAQIVLIRPHGNHTLVSVFLDHGLETSCVSESMASLLTLPRRKAHVSLNGVGTSGMCTARYIAHFTLQSLVDSKLFDSHLQNRQRLLLSRNLRHIC